MYLGLVDSVSVEQTKEKCIGFISLKSDWHELGGPTFDVELIKKVYKLIDIAQQNCITDMEVNPELDGGITLSLYYLDYMFDIIVYKNEDYIMWLQKATEEVYYKESITFNEVVTYIEDFRNKEI